MGGDAVFAIFSIGQKLFEKLQKKTYRTAYVAEHVRRGVAYQIRALRDQRGWSQGDFAKKLGKPQSVVCRLEDPSYGKYTVQTLLEVASTCDVALQVRFVPYSVFLPQSRDVSTQSLNAPSFTDETKLRSNIKVVPLSERPGEGRIQIGGADIPDETGSDQRRVDEMVAHPISA
jgi:transcriptional regulator with XRE-family HTH domain